MTLTPPIPYPWDFAGITIYPNIKYGPDAYHRLDVYLNPVRVPGGNPVLIRIHGGADMTFDKTSDIRSNRLASGFVYYVLNPDKYGQTFYPDIVAVEYRAWQHRQSGSPNYESQLDSPATNPGTGFQSIQGYGADVVDAVQRAIQWVMMHANGIGGTSLSTPTWTWNTDQVGLWGYSFGGQFAKLAAFSDSRPWDSRGATRPWTMTKEAKVRYVMNDSGEVSPNPWVMDYDVMKYWFGILGPNSRAMMERLMLVPDENGQFPSTCAQTDLCNRNSSLYVIRNASADRKNTKLLSLYDIQDTTTTPVSGYATIPPYNKGGHAVEQRALETQACVDAGIVNEPNDPTDPLDPTHGTGIYDSGPGYTNTLGAMEDLCALRMAFMQRSCA